MKYIEPVESCTYVLGNAPEYTRIGSGWDITQNSPLAVLYRPGQDPIVVTQQELVYAMQAMINAGMEFLSRRDSWIRME